MKGWGKFLIIIGIILGFSAITMDASVETGLGERVNNLGLMNLQTNLLIGAGIAFISGILLIGFNSKSSGKLSDNKKCSYCAEIIKREAKICRYCGKEQPFDETLYSSESLKPSQKVKYKYIVFALVLLLVTHQFYKLTHAPKIRNGIAYVGNGNELYTGKYEEHSPDGQKIEANYKDGKENGLWTWWYTNGQKKSEGRYIDGKKNGIWKDWYENGQKENEITYENGKTMGLWTGWYKNGQKEQEKNFKGENLNGLATFWYENGQKEHEARYLDGKMNGLATFWDENGKLKGEAIFKDGKQMN